MAPARSSRRRSRIDSKAPPASPAISHRQYPASGLVERHPCRELLPLRKRLELDAACLGLRCHRPTPSDHVLCEAEPALDRRLRDCCLQFRLEGIDIEPIPTYEMAEGIAEAVRQQAGATHGLAVLVGLDRKESRGGNFSATICIAISDRGELVARRSRLNGNHDWIRLGPQIYLVASKGNRRAASANQR